MAGETEDRTDASQGPGRTPRLAIGAIFKNEGPYVLEWVAFHRALGVERFFIADNASTDETTAILAGLHRAGIVRHIPFPHVPGEPPQLPAYRAILRDHGAEADWIAFIDADEFLLPAPPLRGLPPALAGFDTDPGIGAVVVNWAVYGSSGHRAAADSNVIERFTRRARRDDPVNRHYKTLLRPRAFADTAVSPHAFRLAPGFCTVQADGTPLADPAGPREGRSPRILWEPLRLNHYVVKSWEEFEHRKRARGRATRADQLRDGAFFERHDLNNAPDPVPDWLVEATRTEQDRLRKALAAGPERRVRDPGVSLRVYLDHWRGTMKRTARRVMKRPHGAIDAVEIRKDRAIVKGWALTAGARSPAGFAVRLGDRPAQVLAVERTDRIDVLRHFPDAEPGCGFRLTVAWPAHLDPADRPMVTVAPADDRGPIVELRTGGSVRWGVAPGAQAGVPAAPALPPDAGALLAEAIAGASCYLEYGSGGSTMLALDHGVPSLVSVESDADWLAAVRAKAKGRLDAARHHLLHVDIGPTKALGYPVDDTHWQRFQAYALDPWRLCRARGLAPDVVLVDGRFRLACFLATLLFAPPGCRILFDDYADRPYYHAAAGAVAPLRTVGRMAEFAVPAALPRDAIWLDLTKAVADPR